MSGAMIIGRDIKSDGGPSPGPDAEAAHQMARRAAQRRPTATDRPAGRQAGSQAER